MRNDISDRAAFVRFVRALKGITMNQASGILGMTRGSVRNYEVGFVVITDKILDRLVENYGVTDFEIKLYVEYESQK
ncbi:MAG TPA: helix-turn-helix transcriptional regulator [Desulfosporosinus sp.]|nr:helix-turn-helix transcriptional regulator [Desulfosporosinus sp.]